MFYLTKRTLVIGALLLSSAFAAPSNPSRWNIDPSDPTKIQFWDKDGALVTTKEFTGSLIGKKSIFHNGKIYLVRMKEFPAAQQPAQTHAPAATIHTTPLVAASAPSSKGTITRLTGHKRQRSEAQPPKSAPPVKKQRSKYEGIDFSKGVCWRIDPNNNSRLQVLGADNNVIFSDTIKTRMGKRKLQNGSLYIVVAIQTINKHYSFPRHPDDKASLLRSDFDIIEGEKIRVLNQAPPSFYRNIDFTKVKSWRVSPNKPEHFDLLDQNGTVLNSGPTQTKVKGSLPITK